MQNKSASPALQKAKQPRKTVSAKAALHLVKQFIIGNPDVTDYDAYLALDVITKALKSAKHSEVNRA